LWRSYHIVLLLQVKLSYIYRSNHITSKMFILQGWIDKYLWNKNELFASIVIFLKLSSVHLWNDIYFESFDKFFKFNQCCYSILKIENTLMIKFHLSFSTKTKSQKMKKKFTIFSSAPLPLNPPFPSSPSKLTKKVLVFTSSTAHNTLAHQKFPIKYLTI